MKKYKHFISLGYFCSVAQELERIGLRDCSSPFDWCISDWKGVERAISTHFENFLNYENLYQDKTEPLHYKDMEYNIAFFHDFDKYKSLSEQLASVQKKYERRIERFYKDIAEPTLFVRYICDECGREEIDYIEENYTKIVELLKSFNSNNEIIFIANEETKSEKVNIYSVKKDENDLVARWPLEKNSELDFLLKNVEYEKRKVNYNRYIQKKKREKKLLYKIVVKTRRQIKRLVCKTYIHERQY